MAAKQAALTSGETMWGNGHDRNRHSYETCFHSVARLVSKGIAFGNQTWQREIMKMSFPVKTASFLRRFSIAMLILKSRSVNCLGQASVLLSTMSLDVKYWREKSRWNRWLAKRHRTLDLPFWNPIMIYQTTSRIEASSHRWASFAAASGWSYWGLFSHSHIQDHGQYVPIEARCITCETASHTDKCKLCSAGFFSLLFQ